MSHWNYRVVGHDTDSEEPWFAIHEVYYEDDGSPRLMSLNPIYAKGETLDGLKEDMAMMFIAFSKPIFVPPDHWSHEVRIDSNVVKVEASVP